MKHVACVVSIFFCSVQLQGMENFALKKSLRITFAESLAQAARNGDEERCEKLLQEYVLRCLAKGAVESTSIIMPEACSKRILCLLCVFSEVNDNTLHLPSDVTRRIVSSFLGHYIWCAAFHELANTVTVNLPTLFKRACLLFTSHVDALKVLEHACSDELVKLCCETVDGNFLCQIAFDRGYLAIAKLLDHRVIKARLFVLLEKWCGRGYDSEEDVKDYEYIPLIAQAHRQQVQGGPWGGLLVKQCGGGLLRALNQEVMPYVLPEEYVPINPIERN